MYDFFIHIDPVVDHITLFFAIYDRFIYFRLAEKMLDMKAVSHSPADSIWLVA